MSSETKERWRSSNNTLNATPDHRNELDEIFMSADFVHVERMANRAFYVGVDLKDGGRVLIHTGVAEGVWYFNVTHDVENGSDYSVQKPASYGRLSRPGERSQQSERH